MEENKLSNHSKDRLNERTNFNMSDINKLNRYATKRGYTPTRFTGEFKEYLENRIRNKRTNIKVYRGYIFIYEVYGETQILKTVYSIPEKYRDDYLKQMENKNHQPGIVKNEVKKMLRKYNVSLDDDDKKMLYNICQKAEDYETVENDLILLRFDKQQLLKRFVWKLIDHYRLSPTIRDTIWKEFDNIIKEDKKNDK